MATYNIGFAEKLVEGANMPAARGTDSFDVAQVITYVSLLSCEISLKALLERAGVPVPDIRKRSHRLAEILDHIGECEVEVDVVDGHKKWVSAVRVRSVVVDPGYSDATIGKVLSAERNGQASTYPNEIRYGDRFNQYPPDLLLRTADALLQWAQEHWNAIRVKP